MTFANQHMMHVPTSSTSAGARADQRRGLLRRIAGIYMVIGSVIVFGVMVISTLEAIGINAVYVPVRESVTTEYNAAAILPGTQSPLSQPAVITTATPPSLPASLSSAISPSNAGGESAATSTLPAPARGPEAPTTSSNPILNPPSIARITLPSIGIDAPVVVRGLDANGVMQTSGEPWSVAWYDFTSHPVNGGNAVFSGHVDYIDIGPAVFWRLGDIQQGDQIEIVLDGGSVLGYTVSAMTTIPATIDQATLHQILGPTSTASITLITCSGSYDPSSEQYDQRLIVRAERVP